MPDEDATYESLAWAAGFFEGEGCFSTANRARGGRKAALAVSVNNTDLSMLQRFHRIVGVGSISGPRLREGQKPIWQWRATSFERFQAVAVMLWPWLSDRRRARARELLLADETSPRRRNRVCEVRWCSNDHAAHGLCQTHYDRKRRGLLRAG